MQAHERYGVAGFALPGGCRTRHRLSPLPAHATEGTRGEKAKTSDRAHCEMEFRYVNPYRDKGEGYQEATANTIYTDLGVGTTTSHILGAGYVASGIIHCGHRLQDNGLNKDNAREVLKGAGMARAVSRC